MSGEGRVPVGLPPDGLDGFLSAGLISGFGLLSGLADGVSGLVCGRADGFLTLLDCFEADDDGFTASLFDEFEDLE